MASDGVVVGMNAGTGEVGEENPAIPTHQRYNIACQAASPRLHPPEQGGRSQEQEGGMHMCTYMCVGCMGRGGETVKGWLREALTQRCFPSEGGVGDEYSP